MYEYTANGSLLYKSNNYLEHFEEATSAGEQEEEAEHTIVAQEEEAEHTIVAQEEEGIPSCQDLREFDNIKEIIKDCKVEKHAERILDKKATSDDYARFSKCLKDNNLDLDCIVTDRDINKPFKEIIKYDEYKDHKVIPFCKDDNYKIFEEKCMRGKAEVGEAKSFLERAVDRIWDRKATEDDFIKVSKCIKDNNISSEMECIMPSDDGPLPAVYRGKNLLKDILKYDEYKDHGGLFSKNFYKNKYFIIGTISFVVFLIIVFIII